MAVHIDPEKVMAYCAAANSYTQTIEQAGSAMERAFADLHSDWYDGNYQQAKDTFDQFIRLTGQFCQQAAALHQRIAALAQTAGDIHL